MSLQIGQQLGSYEITALLGKGGMGEVYRARDMKLKRDVAIKILPEEFSRDADRVSRFQREAEVLASLNHPNIAAIHSLEKANGAFFLVLELVEGETLDERIRRGPIPVDEALDIAKHICEALETAHEKGIVHRDMKPANIKLTSNSNVKVLDFGLAKVREAGTEATTLSNSPTLMTGASAPGMILGTAAYMAPEQARGKSVDKRADIWAFGVIMYELLSGNRLYKGETVADTLSAVLHGEPDLEKVQLQFRLLLQRCLEKDPKKRLRDIGDAMPLMISAPPEAPSARQALTSRLPWAVAAVFGLAALALAAIHFLEKPPVRPAVLRFQIRLPADAKFTPGGSFTISSDGRHVAFSAVNANNRPGVWMQDLDANDARELAGTFTGPNPPPFFWSPDSHYVVYSENSPRLKKVDITTGAIQDICDKPGPPIGGSWNKDGLIIFGSNTAGLWKVSAAGGTPAPLTKLDDSRHEREHELPSFLPDGHHFLYLRLSATNPEDSGIFAGSIDDAPERQSKKRILATSFGAYYVPGNDSGSGWLLFLREGTLMAQPFDSAKLELSSEPVPIAEEVGSQYETGYFSAATDALVYRTSRNLDFQLTWFDRQGMVVGKVGEPGSLGNARISPDGTQVAYVKSGTNLADQDIWVLNLKKDSSTRLTFGPRQSLGRSPDGSEIVFASNRDGVFNLFHKPTNGAREEQLLLRSDLNKLPQSWSPDGRFLLYATSPKSILADDKDLWILPMQDADHTPFPFQQTRFDEGAARFSPDGRWIAYTSNQSGRYEIYVREFSASPGSTRTGGTLVSKGGGTTPEWRSDGKELTYVNRSGNNILLMSVSVDTSRTFEASIPKELFRIPQGATTVSAAGDLKRFLIPIPVERNGPQVFNIILNWTSLLKAK
jgi:serine/threonine protein kinase